MSRARLVIIAVVVRGPSGRAGRRRLRVHRAWVYKLLARYRVEGEAAFQPRSRRPNGSPTATAAPVVELVLRLRKELAGQGLDAGAHTICWHLEHHHRITVSAATVWRILSRAGQVAPEPKKRPRSSYVRFQADLPNQMWQTDFTHVRLADGSATGRDVEVLNFLDDHSRYLLACLAFGRVSGSAVVSTFREAIALHGVPASVLSDKGMVFTTRFSGGQGGRNGFEHELHRLGSCRRTPPPTTRRPAARWRGSIKR